MKESRFIKQHAFFAAMNDKHVSHFVVTVNRRIDTVNAGACELPFNILYFGLVENF